MSSVLVKLIFWGCKMDIYMALSGEKKPQKPTQKPMLPCPSSISHHYMAPTFILPSMKWIWRPLISSLNLLCISLVCEWNNLFACLPQQYILELTKVIVSAEHFESLAQKARQLCKELLSILVNHFSHQGKADFRFRTSNKPQQYFLSTLKITAAT